MVHRNKGDDAMQLIYAQDWMTEHHGWSTAASMAKGATTPTRVRVGHPLAEWAIRFDGNGGWAIRAETAPAKSGVLEIGFYAYICAQTRNALSLNVRDAKGGLIYKYSFGEAGRIWANCQPRPDGGEDQPAKTSLSYRPFMAYKLTSYHDIGSGKYTLDLYDPSVDSMQSDATEWACRSKASPAMLDFDQEGSSAMAFLGKIEVYQL